MCKKINLAVFFIGILLFGLPISMMEDFSKIELMTIYEQSFDKIIVDAVFDTATVSIETAKSLGWKEEYINSVKKRENLKIEYPRIIKTSLKRGNIGFLSPDIKRSSRYVNEVGFYNSNGLILKKMPISWDRGFEYIFLSPQRKYLLVSKVPTEYYPEHSAGVLYDANGSEIVKIEGMIPVAVSDEGLMIAADLRSWRVPSEAGGSFYLYDKNGYLIKEIENPDKKKTAAFFAKFSPDGQFAILAFTAPDTKPTYFYVIDKGGNIIGYNDLPKYRFSASREEAAELEGDGFAVILDKIFGNTLSLNGEQYLFFFDWKGDLKWKTSLEARGNMVVKFSEDGSKVYVVSSEGYVWCIDVKNGRILWKHKKKWMRRSILRKRQPWDVPIFRELEIRGDKVFVIGKKGRDWHSSTFFVFDSETGNLLKKADYPGEKITFGGTAEDISIINLSRASISIFK